MIANTSEYKALHQWIRRHLPRPQTCPICNTKVPNDVVNRDHQYTKNLEDWFWSCRKCHMRYDFDKGYRKGHKEFGINNPFFGKKHSEETRLLLSQLAQGKYVGDNNPNSRVNRLKRGLEKL